jgi:dienelactone hydrolase
MRDTFDDICIYLANFGTIAVTPDTFNDQNDHLYCLMRDTFDDIFIYLVANFGTIAVTSDTFNDHLFVK